MGLDNLGVRGVDHTHMFPVLLPRNHALLLLKIVVCYLLIRLAHSPIAHFRAVELGRSAMTLRRRSLPGGRIPIGHKQVRLRI